jgi:hypothetical protein
LKVSSADFFTPVAKYQFIFENFTISHCYLNYFYITSVRNNVTYTCCNKIVTILSLLSFHFIAPALKWRKTGRKVGLYGRVKGTIKSHNKLGDFLQSKICQKRNGIFKTFDKESKVQYVF